MRACGVRPGHRRPRQKSLAIGQMKSGVYFLQRFIPPRWIQNQGRRHAAVCAIGQPSRRVSPPSGMQVPSDGGAGHPGPSPAGAVRGAPWVCVSPGHVAAGRASDPGRHGEGGLPTEGSSERIPMQAHHGTNCDGRRRRWSGSADGSILRHSVPSGALGLSPAPPPAAAAAASRWHRRGGRRLPAPGPFVIWRVPAGREVAPGRALSVEGRSPPGVSRRGREFGDCIWCRGPLLFGWTKPRRSRRRRPAVSRQSPESWRRERGQPVAGAAWALPWPLWPRTPVSVRVALHCAPSLPSLPHGPGPSKAEAVFVTFLFREREAWTGTFEVPGKWIELAPKTFEFALCEPHRRAALPPEPSNTGSSGTSSYVELTGFARPGYLLARCSSVLPAGEDGCVTVPRLGRPPPRSRAGCSDPREPSLLRLEWSH